MGYVSSGSEDFKSQDIMETDITQISPHGEDSSRVMAVWGPICGTDYSYLPEKSLRVKCFKESEFVWWIQTLTIRRNEMCNFLKKCKHRTVGGEGPDDNLVVCIEVSAPFMDYIGCYIGNSYVSTKCEVETALSWLSTLGGACSALGDLSVQFAQVAGQISMKQLQLAMKLGDPLIASRCRIYAALSLMQMGDLISSRKIVEGEYKYALAVGDDLDPKLRRMCLGVWAKLQYLWKNSIKGKRNVITDGDTKENKSITLSSCVLVSITLARDNSDFLIPSAIEKSSECVDN